MRGIVVLSVVLAFLLLEGKLWGDTLELTGAQKPRSLLTPGQPAPDFVAHDPDGTSIALRDSNVRLNFCM